MLNHPSSKTAIYADGAGLGASKGKDIDKYADGYSGYVSMAQDSVSRDIGYLCLLLMSDRLGTVMGRREDRLRT